MDMNGYYGQLGKRVLEGLRQIDKTSHIENKRVELPVGGIEICVVRGRVLEKAATARIQIKTKNPETGEDTQFDVFQIKTYPVNPKIPILLFNMENRAAQEDRFGGFLDVAPVACSGEDLKFLQTGIKKLTEKHGVAYEPLRKKLIDIYKMDHWVGAANAAIGMRLDLSVEEAELVREAGMMWVEKYFTIVEKRQNESYSRAHEELMNTVRARIMEFYREKDMSFSIIQKLGVALENMALIHFAPTIRY